MLETPRVFPRWLHVWSIITIVATACLLILGGIVTTFRVGMADPIWPTEPWYLATIDWSEHQPGFLIEHAHRAAGFLVGGLASLLVIGLWLYHPSIVSRLLAVLALLALLGAFGALHGIMIRQVKEDATSFVWPPLFVQTSLGAYGVVLILACVDRIRGIPGATGRLIGTLALAGVMIQGLLGGVRVALNAWAGTDLATIHGTFAQVVFSLLLSLTILTAAPHVQPLFAPNSVARKLRWQTLCLVLFCFLQICWGAWVRHSPGPLGNRLHLIFAFVVVGFATLVIKQALLDRAVKPALRLTTSLLMALLTIQLLLGVEAWLGKFLPFGYVENETLTLPKAWIRTLHAHTGTWLLGVSVILMIQSYRLRRQMT